MKAADQKRVTALSAKILILSNQRREIVEADDLKRARALVGKCYTTGNSWRQSVDEASGKKEKLWRWPVYCKIVGAEDGSLICYQFEVRPYDGSILTRPKEWAPIWSFDRDDSMWTEIGALKFTDAFIGMRNTLAAQKP